MEVIRQAIQLVSDMEKYTNDFSNRLSEPFNPRQRYRFYIKTCIKILTCILTVKLIVV